MTFRRGLGGLANQHGCLSMIWRPLFLVVSISLCRSIGGSTSGRRGRWSVCCIVVVVWLAVRWLLVWLLIVCIRIGIFACRPLCLRISNESGLKEGIKDFERRGREGKKGRREETVMVRWEPKICLDQRLNVYALLISDHTFSPRKKKFIQYRLIHLHLSVFERTAFMTMQYL